MRKLVLVIFLIVLLSVQAWAGDSLKVIIREAKNMVGITDVADSLWNGWANQSYQWALMTGYALIRDTIIVVNPYVYPDSFKYAVPSDHYEWIGMTIISDTPPPSNMSRNIKLLIPGQEYEIGLGFGTGATLFAMLTQTHIRFYPNPTRWDTVLYTYYSKDQRLGDTDIVAIDEVYNTAMVDYILSRYWPSTASRNLELGSYYRQLAEVELDKITQLRRKVKADYVIPPKILEK